jgi:hypothetical protein
MSLTKLFLARNNLINPGQGEFGKGTGKSLTFFLQCSLLNTVASLQEILGVWVSVNINV